MEDKKKYYITTAIAYTSGKPHIGNTYEIVLADSIARYKRQQGYDVFFQTGTDEHGQKIELKAEEAGISPQEFVDNVSGEIKRIWDLMDTSSLSEQQTSIMKSRFRRFSRSCMIRETFTRASMRVCTVHLVNHSSQLHSLLTANALTAADHASLPGRRLTSLSLANIPISLLSILSPTLNSSSLSHVRMR